MEPAQGRPMEARRRSDVPGYRELAQMALDLRWSWNHAADELWSRLDPELWESTHNPWFVLRTVSQDRLRSVTSDPNFLKLAGQLAEEKRSASESPGWFQQTHPGAPLKA